MDSSDDSFSTNSDGSVCRVDISWDGRTGCDARIRGLPPIAIDMPVQHGGAGINPCPHEILFSAVGSCFLGTFLVFQRQLRLRLVDLQVLVEGTVDVAKRGKNRGKYEIAGIDVHVRVAVEGSEDERDIVSDCIRMTKDHCPTTRALQDSVPIRIVSEIRTLADQTDGKPNEQGVV